MEIFKTNSEVKVLKQTVLFTLLSLFWGEDQLQIT